MAKNSSNINEVTRTVLNLFFSFKKRFCLHKKHQKAPKKHQKAPKSAKMQPNKSTKCKEANKNKKYAFLCFMCTRRKENRK